MSSWIKADIHFAENIAYMYLPRWWSRRGDFNPDYNKPDEVEAEVRKVIDEYRPDLKDCVILGLRYAFEYQDWQFLIAHPSLPKHQDGAMFDRLPLIKDDEPTIVQ